MTEDLISSLTLMIAGYGEKSTENIEKFLNFCHFQGRTHNYGKLHR